MTRDDDLRVRPGRIRSEAGPKRPTALRQVRIATARAGGRGPGSSGGPRGGSTFGRGRLALARSEGRGAGRRQVVVKARVVRHGGRLTPAGALGAHLDYLQRDGVTRAGEPGQLFDATTDRVDGSAFAVRAKDDRHHFRFIVSPEDAAELGDLRAWARDLMQGVQTDLGTPLDWVAVDHWNTARPHLHLVIRGRLEDGQDLVISRDYISRGVRARAEALMALELGSPGPRERAAALHRDAEAEHWTRLDQRLERLADRARVVDLRRGGPAPEADRRPLLQRARTLVRLGLAAPAGSGRWRLVEGLRGRLQDLARSKEIAGRFEAATREREIARSPEQWAATELSDVVSGRVIARGRDDELRGTGFAVIDGLDGRLHHLTLPDAAAADPRVGALVRASPPARGVHPMTVVLSDLDLAAQTTARGATWLDRKLLAPEPLVVAGGFANEVLQARDRRIEHLVSEGLAERRDGEVRFAPDLLKTLQARDLSAAAKEIEGRTGLTWRPLAPGDPVSGIYRRRMDLASGRFAVVEAGGGFSLAPWRPVLDRNLGRSVSGVMGPGVHIEWRPARGPGR